MVGGIDDFKVHPTILNLLLLQTSVLRGPIDPSRWREFVRDFASRIAATHVRRGEDLRTRLGERYEPDKDLMDPHAYRPQVYTMWGADDLAVFYTSRTFVPPPPSESAMSRKEPIDLRQLVFQCLLPDFSTDSQPCFNATALHALGKDFDARWRLEGRKLTPESGARSDPDLRFVAVVRLKLAPFATWRAGGTAESTATESLAFGMTNTMNHVAKRLRKWCAPSRDPENQVEVRVPARHALLGFTMAWNELIVVALAADVESLGSLVLDLRMQHLTLPCASDGETSTVHVVLHTETALGFDHAIEDDALSRFPAPKERCAGDEPTAGKVRDCFAEALEFARNTVFSRGHRTEAPGKSARRLRVSMQARFSTMPGHEMAIADLRPRSHKDKPLPITLGLTDIALPRLRVVERVGRKHKSSSTSSRRALTVNSEEAAILSSLLRVMVHGGADSVRSFGQYFTAITFRPDLKDLEKVPEKHVRVDPRSHCLESVVEDPLARWVPCPDRVRDALRTLQISHTQTEQILSTLGTFRWLWESLWLWEHVSESLPALNAFVDALEAMAETVRGQSGLTGSIPMAEVTELAGLPHWVDQFIAATRRFLTSPHWRIAPLSPRADLNVRRRGSFEQLLSITNLIASSLMDHLLGPQACLVTLGDRSEPTKQLVMDVEVFDVPSAAIDLPIMFDGVVEQVCHSYLRRVLEPAGAKNRLWRRIRDRREAGATRANSSPKSHASWRDAVEGEIGRFVFAQRRFEELNRAVYVGSAKDDIHFTGSLTDYIACRVLRITAERWIHSQTLRALLSIPSHSISARRRALCQSSAEWMLILRRACALFAIQSALAIYQKNVEDAGGPDRAALDPEDWLDLHERIVDGVRETLIDKRSFFKRECLLAPGERDELRDRIAGENSDEKWKRFVEEDLLPGLHWLQSPSTLRLALQFFIALRDSLRDLPSERSSGELDGPRRLWPTVARELHRLRIAFRGVTRVVNVSVSDVREVDRGTHVSNSSPKGDRTSVSSERLPFDPVSYRRRGPSVETILCPRGRLLIPHGETDREFHGAIHLFFGRMLVLVPAFRRLSLRMFGGMNLLETRHVRRGGAE